jgi:hypothetical protein
MKSIVKSTKELKEFFPELSNTDRFKRKIDEVFKLGYSFEVETKEPLKCFTAKNGKQYKSRILYNGSGFLLKKTFLKKGHIGMKFYNSFPEIFTHIASEPTGTVKVGNEEPFQTYKAEYESTESISWSVLGKYIGKMIKDELVEVCTCGKCGGSGFLPEFAYYADGVCFDCLGIGKWLEVKNS